MKLGLYRFQNQEIRTAEGNMRGGGVRDRPAVNMRRDLRVEQLREACDFFRLPDAAATADVRLQNRHTGLQRLVKLDPRRQSLAGRDRDRRRASNAADGVHLVRRAGFLEPQRVIGLEPAREPNRRCRRHLAVGTEQDIGTVANRFADFAHIVFAAGEFGKRQLAPALETVRTGRILLDRGKAHVEVIERARRGGVTVMIDVGRAFARIAVSRQRLRVQIGIGPQPLVKLAAKQLVNRYVVRLAEDIPDSDLDTAEHAHHADVRPLREAGRVHPAKHGFDMVRVLAGDVALESVLDHFAGDVAGHGNAVTFADAFDTVIGGDLDDHPEGTADAARRHRDPGFDVFEDHVCVRPGEFPLSYSKPTLYETGINSCLINSSSLSICCVGIPAEKRATC